MQRLASTLQKPPTHPTHQGSRSVSSFHSVLPSFRLAAGTSRIFMREFNFTESRVETARHHYALFVQVGNPT